MRRGGSTVDGVPLDEPYIYEPIDARPGRTAAVSCTIDPNDPDHYDSQRCFAPFTVPQGEIWVMGDHRSVLERLVLLLPGPDSGRGEAVPGGRADHESCGRPIPVDDVIGKAVFIVMPPSRWGTIGSPDIMSSAAECRWSGSPTAALPSPPGVARGDRRRGAVGMARGHCADGGRRRLDRDQAGRSRDDPPKTDCTARPAGGEGAAAPGYTRLAAMDEVGRGALAGPVTVGVVVVTASIGRVPPGLRDSKLLTPAARERWLPPVRRWAGEWAVGHASPPPRSMRSAS